MFSIRPMSMFSTDAAWEVTETGAAAEGIFDNPVESTTFYEYNI
jgi:hypothetical protein